MVNPDSDPQVWLDWLSSLLEVIYWIIAKLVLPFLA